MTTSGTLETQKLKENLENQLDRLLQQLSDLEDCKDELDKSEYEETKQETIEQLKEFQESLPRIAKGDVSLVSSLAAIQLATQVAISEAFKTPEVIRLFGKREPQQLREKLTSYEAEFKLGICSKEFFIDKKVEILRALRQLDDKISANELQFLEEHSSSNIMKHFEFEKVTEELG